MKKTPKRFIQIFAGVLTACVLALALCGCGTSQQGAAEIQAKIAALLADDYNLTAVISTDEISSNYGYKDDEGNDYENYMGALIWLETTDETISHNGSEYKAEDIDAYQKSLPPYEEITRAVGSLLASEGYGNYSVEFYHQLTIRDDKTMANTATMLKLNDYENYSAINPILDSLTPVEIPAEIHSGEPLNTDAIKSFIVDNYGFNVNSITLDFSGTEYKITLELAENHGDISQIADWSEDDYSIWQMRVDTITSSVYEIYQFLNESHKVEADITVNIGGHNGSIDEYDPAAWYQGKYTTADPQNLGRLRCKCEDLATKAYNASHSADYPTAADTVNTIF